MDDQTLLDLFTDMTRIHTTYVDRRLRHLDLHTGQGAIISALGVLGPSSQKKLAEYRKVSAATISVMLRRMEKTGLISRSASDESKCNEISLTEMGKKTCDELANSMAGEAEDIFRGLSDEDKEAAERIFRTISENLSRQTV